MHTLSLAEYMQRDLSRRLAGRRRADAASANKLAKIGADFLICPDNTIHQALPLRRAALAAALAAHRGVVAAQAVERGYRRLALTGTRWLVDSNVYPEKLEARGLELPAAERRPSAMRSTASSWTSWCAACSSQRPSPYFQRVISG